MLRLLDEIIDSADGVPIDNYLSQFFANLYLAYFDHKLKQKYKVYYFRYADDIVILANNKEILHEILEFMKVELDKLKLTLKPNYQIFPVEARGIDFLGYVIYHNHIFLRKSIKLRMLKKLSLKNYTSYTGWIEYCNGINLIHSLERKLGIPIYTKFKRCTRKPNNIKAYKFYIDKDNKVNLLYFKNRRKLRWKS